MNVFEELIEELKGENLLEETVIDIRRSEDAPEPHPAGEDGGLDLLEVSQDPVQEDLRSPERIQAALEEEASDPVAFFRKKAMEEVSSLQMVEHVLSGVEREHMKMTPVSYDDLSVKKALHRYLQTAEGEEAEHKQAEFDFMQAVQEWFSSLAKRDANISVANIRRFCENSRPVLSSQALIAMARFYRNSPFSETVRGKFDFVISKLFSREIDAQRRQLLFSNADMIGHLKNLYADWASLKLFEDGAVPEVTEAVEKFSVFSAESDAAGSFDELVASDFFNRVRLFKEEIGELFYVPECTAAGISCNIAIGNRFVDLIRAEKEQSSADVLSEKYGYAFDTLLSSAASKTLLVADLISDEPVEEVEEEEEKFVQPEPGYTRHVEWERAPVAPAASPLRVNKWLVVATILVALVSVAIYMWAETSETTGGVEMAEAISFKSTELQNYLRDGSISNETLYAIAQPSWDVLSEDEKKDTLKKALTFATSIKMKRVNILNRKGRTVGYAVGDKIELMQP